MNWASSTLVLLAKEAEDKSGATVMYRLCVSCLDEAWELTFGVVGGALCCYLDTLYLYYDMYSRKAHVWKEAISALRTNDPAYLYYNKVLINFEKGGT
jgi:hypothetical protein